MFFQSTTTNDNNNNRHMSILGGFYLGDNQSKQKRNSVWHCLLQCMIQHTKCRALSFEANVWSQNEHDTAYLFSMHNMQATVLCASSGYTLSKLIYWAYEQFTKYTACYTAHAMYTWSKCAQVQMILWVLQVLQMILWVLQVLQFSLLYHNGSKLSWELQTIIQPSCKTTSTQQYACWSNTGTASCTLLFYSQA